MNTYYKKKKNRRWTWHSPNFETFNKIDYILVDKNNIVKNFEVLNKVNVDSDHRMIRCKVQIDSKQEIYMYNIRKVINIPRLNDKNQNLMEY